MTTDWPIMSLREAGVSLLDCEHRTPPDAGAGYPYVAIPQVRNGRLDLSDVRRITAEHFAEWTRKARPRTHDVILSRRCNPGETAVVPAGLECALGQNLVLLRADADKMHPPFLRWLVRGPQWWEQIGRFLNVGAVFDSLKCADIPHFKMTIPPVPVQRRIADVLGSLDGKIELNQQANETLEAMARTLFRSWFVDFDPVRAKVDGEQPHGMDAAMAALFPDGFEGSALGPIPKGWRVARWGDIVSLEYGKSLREYESASGSVPVYGTNGRIGWHTTPLCPYPGIVVGRKGAYRGVHYSHVPFFVIDTAYYVKPRGDAELRWAFYEMVSLDINGMDSGSAIPSTSRDDFYALPVIVPPVVVQRRFAEVLSPVWQRQINNDEESYTLAATRDALLPKLLSGEVSVSADHPHSEVR